MNGTEFQPLIREVVEHHVGDAHRPGRFERALPSGGAAWGAVELRLLTLGHDHDRHLAARFGMQRERASDPEDLIVGVRNDADDALAHGVVPKVPRGRNGELRCYPRSLDQNGNAVAAEGVRHRVRQCQRAHEVDDLVGRPAPVDLPVGRSSLPSVGTGGIVLAHSRRRPVEQAVEVGAQELDGRVVGLLQDVGRVVALVDRKPLAGDDVTGVDGGVHVEHRDAGLAEALDHRPDQGRASAAARQHRGVKAEDTHRRNVEDLLRDDLGESDDEDQVRAEVADLAGMVPDTLDLA